MKVLRGINMKEFLRNNATAYRLLRTIVQGICGVIVANMDLFVSYIQIDPAMKPVIVALVMAILSPIMSELGKES